MIFSNDIFGILNFLGIAILIVMQTILITKNNIYEWYSLRFIEDFFYNIVYKAFSNLFKPFVVISKLLKPKIWNEKTTLLKPFIVVALISYIIINYVNIDSIIINENLGRFYKTGQIDTDYLTNLSYDSVQGMTRLLNDKNGDVAKDIKRVLNTKKINLEKDKPWQSFNISEYNAKKILTGYNLK